MKKFYLPLLFLLCRLAAPALATHIAGGELSLQAKGSRSAKFELSLTLYFDELKGEPKAQDAQILIAIYSKATNARIDTFSLNLLSNQAAPYPEPACTQALIRTSVLNYRREVSLNPQSYQDPAGYYVSWERCCRNAGIVNIARPEETGTVFYLEFPALLQGGQRFPDSSPVFAPLAGDIACVKEPFSLSFAATDADGDQLAYSLVTPLKGRSALGDAVPPPAPAPYAPIGWAAGYSAGAPLPGAPGIRVDARTGRVTFAPDQAGLFAFAVRCEEYRNGQKIGEVRREFQVLVVDCPANRAPDLFVRIKGEAALYREGDVLVLPDAGPACLEVLVTDDKAHSPLALQAAGPGGAAGGITLTPASGSLRAAGDTLRSDLCLPGCAGPAEEPVVITLVVTDQGCPVARADSLTLRVRLPVRRNAPPSVTTSLALQTAAGQPGKALEFVVTGHDPDADVLSVRAEGRNFDLAAAGMHFAPPSPLTGSFALPFSWLPDCRVQPGEYVVDFLVTDNACQPAADTVTVRLTLADVAETFAGFTPPNVFTPNHDGVNDYFEIPSLPADNCRDFFQEVKIYNRWGQPVFSGTRRDFQWAGDDAPAGTYFYFLKYARSQYKGWVSLLR